MKVLVVDDERDVQVLFEQRFRKEIKEHKIEFAFAHSGEEALIYLEKDGHSTLPILSDINMPGMNGLELLKQVKQKYKAHPPKVMMISAYGDLENYNTAMSLGADEFLVKPL